MTVERKEKEKELRRSQILDAAQELFFSESYDKITIASIAKAAQLAKGTLYLYFSSKEALYCAVSLRGARLLNEMFHEAVAGKPSGLEKASALGMTYYEFYRRYPQYFEMCMHAENLPTVCSDDVNALELQRVSFANLEVVLNAITEGTHDGSIKPDLDPLLTSIFLIQSTRTMIQLPTSFKMILTQTGTDQAATVKFALQALRHFLQNTENKKLEEKK
ncbi:MAG: TetR/AcrR family transcriptional regulator [Candidatus Bathyarchaeota archaeon]|nr:TetR/AcrR family transcriptional regulator [Candidatus Bathyarchaeota archaeon]